MKKIIYGFLETIVKLLFTFVVIFISVTLSSNNQNFIYKFLDNFGDIDASGKKQLLSAFVVLILGIIQAIIWLILKGLAFLIDRYFKKLGIKFSFKVDGKICSKTVFNPVGGSYEEKEVDVVLDVTPAGKLSMLLFKILNIKVELFFNPKILDLNLKNDPEWMGQDSGISNLDENQMLRIFLLKDYELGGVNNNTFKKTETLIIIPKRVKENSANIDYRISTRLGKSRFSKNMYDVSFKKSLSISCKGVK